MNYAVTPWTVTLMAAYLQYYTPKRLNGRHLSLTDLRGLSVWLDCPRTQVRSLRKHPLLAAHLTLLYALGFLDLDDNAYSLQPALTEWLFGDHTEQVCQLLDGLDESRFTNAAGKLKLDDCLRVDYRTFLQQALERQLATDPAPTGPVVWQMPSEAQQQLELVKQSWQLLLPAHLAPWLLFDLLQLGDMVTRSFAEESSYAEVHGGHAEVHGEKQKNKSSSLRTYFDCAASTALSTSQHKPAVLGVSPRSSFKVLVCTPVTVARAGKRGYGEQVIRWLLEEATQAPLPCGVGRQLTAWIKRGHSYQVETVQLLTTAQDHQLSEILGKRQLKQHVYRQISPRDAVVSSDLVPKLKRWLAKQQYELETETFVPTEPGQAAYSWLGLRVLIGLKEIMRLPLAAPTAALEQLEESLSAGQQGEMEALARRILSDLRTVIRGRDSFLPAVCSPLPEMVARLQEAIKEQKPLLIQYQSLGDYQPQYRRIQPYRLEEREPLYYLYAYCYRAEADLTFRVDRISEICNP
jgi:hypothetical protein